MSHGTRWGMLALLAATQVEAAVPRGEVQAAPDSMVVIESRGTQRELSGGQTDVTVTESLWRDRRCIETDSRFTNAKGVVAPLKRHRAILALDRGVVWNVDLGDSTYGETPFATAREFAAALPQPIVTGEKALGAGERIAGLPTLHYELHHRGPTAAASKDSVDYVQSVWVARGREVARAVAFARRPQPRGAGLPAAAADLARRHQGVPVRIVTWLKLPPTADLTRMAATDSEARAIGLDVKDRTLLMGGAEVTSIGVVPAARERFEPPSGWTRKPDPERAMLDQMKRGKALAR